MTSSTGCHAAVVNPELLEREWVPFPGGELEGKRPKALCEACRRRRELSGGHLSSASARPRAVCFQCYRAELERERAMGRAAALHTATEERFQCTLPFEPVNRARLERLRSERGQARATARLGGGAYAERRTKAQLAARRAIQQAVADIRQHHRGPTVPRAIAAIAHAAELQLPHSWLPFVKMG